MHDGKTVTTRGVKTSAGAGCSDILWSNWGGWGLVFETSVFGRRVIPGS
jgi:hypothetical protein